VRGVGLETVDSNHADPGLGFSHVGVMVPIPAIVTAAIASAADGALVDLFAGFAVGTRVPVDVDALLAKRVFLFGTSGSIIPDMQTVVQRLESGQLDSDISVYAVSGLEGVIEALEAVKARTTSGKIVIYPQLTTMGLIPLSEMAEHFPDVAETMENRRWGRAAEEALLAAVGGTNGEPEDTGDREPEAADA
jgi:hypothetical protein